MFHKCLNFIQLALMLIYCDSTTKSFSIESRIIGGKPSGINIAPYIGSIRYKKNNTAPFEHRCSATIYSSQVMLTTATCLVGLQAKRLHVKVGSTYRTQHDGYLYLVDKYIIHPEYNIWFIDNDLALLILASDLSVLFSKVIAPIALMSHVPPASSSATIAGWGVTDNNSDKNFSENLQIAQVNVVEIVDCKRSYGEHRISSAMLCAAGNDIDACLGDAGGPLVYKDKVFALISWGNGCSNLKFPGVYTNLVYFKEWIESKVKKIDL